MKTVLTLLTALLAVVSARPQTNSPTRQHSHSHLRQQYNPHSQFSFRAEAPAPPSSGAEPPAPDPTSTTPIPIISYSKEINPDGSYHYSYETGNGIKADESGHVDNAGEENEAIEVQGSYSFIGDDGNLYSVEYTAGKGGFQPKGDHLPTPPPLPAEVQQAIDQHLAALATATPEEEEASSSSENSVSPPDNALYFNRNF